MSAGDPSIVIVAPPTTSPGGPYEREYSRYEADEGLLSSTPSSVPGQGPLVSQLEQLMTIIDHLRRENNDLRNALNDQNLVIHHKSKNLEQINSNYRLYDNMVKEKYQETAKKFDQFREEISKLKLENERQIKDDDVGRRIRASQGVSASEEDPAQQEATGDGTGSWVTLDLTEQSAADCKRLTSQLNEEKQKTTKLTEELRTGRAASDTVHAKLKAAFIDLSNLREDRAKENRDLRAKLGIDVDTYKKQIHSLHGELKETKRSLVLHGKKVQELHDANLQFDEVNSAYHNKLAMYEEELKKRDAFIEQQKQNLQRISADRRALDEKTRKVQEAYRDANKKVVDKSDEVNSLTARIFSMEESLESRDRKLQGSEEDKTLLNVQLGQYQDDFKRERLAREHSHHTVQEKDVELETLRRKNADLQDVVDNYTQLQMHTLSSQYSNPGPTSPVTPPSPGQTQPLYARMPLPYGGSARGYDWNEQGRQGFRGGAQDRVEEPIQHICPICEESFSEAGSLQIHVNAHFAE